MEQEPANERGTVAACTARSRVRRAVGPVTVLLAVLVACLAVVNATLGAGASGQSARMTADRVRHSERTAARDDLLGSTAATTPPRPTVDAVPDPSERRPISVIGRIRIPTLGLDTELRDQITQESIDLGPSHWPGSALPGAEGNAVIAGHRSTHGAPFRGLGDLRLGDAVALDDGSGRSFTYAVTGVFVVLPDDMWITDQDPGRTLTLFTCHPVGSAAQRLVVKATLVN